MVRTISKPFAFGLVVAGQLCIFALLAWLSYERTVEQEKLRLTVDARASAEQIAYALRLVDAQLDNLIDMARRNPDWTEQADSEAESALRQAANSAPHVLGAGLADERGIMRGLFMAGGEAMVSGMDISNRTYFTVHRDGLAVGSFLSEPIVSRVNGRWLLIVSRRLTGEDGSFRGALMVAVNPTYFAEKFALLDELPIARRVFTDSGALVAIDHPTQGGLDRAMEETPQQVAQERLGEADIFWEPGTRGAEVLTAAAPVRGWSLTATASMGQDAILADWQANLLGKGLALTLSLVAMLMLILVVYRQQDRSTRMEHRFRALIEEAIDGVIIHDSGLVLFANDAAGQILGLSHGSELRGRSLTEFIPDELRGEAVGRWGNVKETGEAVTKRRLPRQRIDGTPIYLDISAQPIDWGGRSTIRSSITEVTDQVNLAMRDERRAAVLAAVNEAHSIYLNQARDGDAFAGLLCQILALSGAVYGRIAEVIPDDEGGLDLQTRAASIGALGGRPCAPSENIDGEVADLARLEGLGGDSLRSGNLMIANAPRRYSVPSQGQGADLVTENVMLLPLKLEDEVLGEVSLANRRGGFDQKLAEELGPVIQALTRILADDRSRRLREAAERASRSKSAFLAHISHELRTPLAGVVANLELLGGTDLEREQDDLVQASMTAGKALLGVIGNTLDFSKIEADELILDMAAFDPAAMVREVCSIYFATAQDKGLTVATIVDATVPKSVIADEMRLRQVLANLVGNSLKFTEHGQVAVCLSAQKMEDGRAELRLSVDDTGIGFDPDKADSLFKPFGQESSSTTRQFGGTGLGLTIAQRLIALHDGEIKCYSQPDTGSSFVVSLPVAVEQWSDAEIRSMEGEDLIFHFPQGDLPQDLEDTLVQEGARVELVRTVAELLNRSAAQPDRRCSLIVDWDALESADEQAIAAAPPDGSAQIFAAASCDDADRRRRILFHRTLRPITKPLSAVNLCHAVLGDDWRQSDLEDDSVSAKQGGYQVFEPGKGPKILVVEDQPMNQLVLKRQLRRLGADCDLAENGQEGLELMERNGYEVVITDCSMPVMDGFEMARSIRRLEAAGRPRSAIIALTANAVTGDAQRCYDAGMDAYLSKPVGLSELSRAIEQWWHPSLRATEPAGDPAVEASGVEIADDETLEPPIDRQGLAQLIGDDDAATIDALILDFFDSWQACLFALHDPWTQRDADALRAAAHAAKGTARCCMASALAATSEALEKQAKDADWGQLRGLIEALEAETDRLQSFIGESGLTRDDERQSA